MINIALTFKYVYLTFTYLHAFNSLVALGYPLIRHFSYVLYQLRFIRLLGGIHENPNGSCPYGLVEPFVRG